MNASVSYLLEKQINMNANSMKGLDMRENYDFSESTANPYARKLKKQITIRLDEDVIEYFKDMAEQKGIPYQNLINLYLKDCADKHKELKLDWIWIQDDLILGPKSWKPSYTKILPPHQSSLM